jgi:pseudouridine-5'-phosphate glycosidase
MQSISPSHFQIRDDVKAALEAGQPVVALESTIITHGMEYPQNKDTALALE